MGKRSAVVELFLGDMGSIQRETRPSIQREDQLTMETKLEQIAAKARCEPKLRFTSLAHHITRGRVLEEYLSQLPSARPPGSTARQWRRRRKALSNGLGQSFNPFTVKDTERRTFGASIFQSPESRKNARSAFPLSPTGRSSTARPTCSPPFTSRTSCHTRLVAGQGSAPIMLWRSSMR